MTTKTKIDVEVRCQPGDLWALGEHHRLLCGDATERQSVQRLLSGATVDTVVTDPPYCSGGWQEAGKVNGSIGTTRIDGLIPSLRNDALSTRGYTALLKAAVMPIGARIINIFTDWRMWVYLFDITESSGYGVRSMVVWNKDAPGLGVGWRAQHELILVGIRGKSKDFYSFKQCQGNVITEKRTGNHYHPTEKPVPLLEKILNVTPNALIIYDPFAGSGTTILAAQNQGRRCYAVEIDPVFCDIALHRYEQTTGDTAQLIDRIDPS